MKKIVIELEYNKYDTFGRTECKAHLTIYESEDGFMSEENINRVVSTIRKLYTNKNFLNPCVTFGYKDAMNVFSNINYTGRFFTLGGDYIDKIIWRDAYTTDTEEIKSVTKKHILDLYKDCVGRAEEAVA